LRKWEKNRWSIKGRRGIIIKVEKRTILFASKEFSGHRGHVSNLWSIVWILLFGASLCLKPNSLDSNSTYICTIYLFNAAGSPSLHSVFSSRHG
jgi:hypothetical protein